MIVRAFSASAVILAVDDDKDVLVSLAEILAAAGYLCYTAVDPESALLLARQIEPDLVICDIALGADETGFDLCEVMHAEPDLREVPVLFLSGADLPDAIERAHAAGGTYYLHKPFDPAALLELVEKSLWMPHLVSTLERPALMAKSVK